MNEITKEQQFKIAKARELKEELESITGKSVKIMIKQPEEEDFLHPDFAYERITPELLKEYGFYEVDLQKQSDKNYHYEKYSPRPILRLVVPKTENDFYGFEIEISIGCYPESNSNSGIISIYHPDEMIPSVPEELMHLDEWTEEQKEIVENYKILFPEFRQPIAWSVTRINRLKDLIYGLTGYTLVKIKEDEQQ